MNRIEYDFEQFPEPLQTRIQAIAAQRGCSVDEVIEGLWDSFIMMMESGRPELTGLAKELQQAQVISR